MNSNTAVDREELKNIKMEEQTVKHKIVKTPGEDRSMGIRLTGTTKAVCGGRWGKEMTLSTATPDVTSSKNHVVEGKITNFIQFGAFLVSSR